MRLLTESLRLCRGSLSALWGFAATLWGLMTVALPFKTFWYIYVSLLGLAGLLSFVLVLRTLVLLRRPVVEVPVTRERRLFIMKDGFCENMERALTEPRYKGLGVCFAMGIDCTADLSISTEKGIVASVIRYLDARFGIRLAQLQAAVDGAKTAQFPDKSCLDFGDTLVVSLPADGLDAPIRLLLIANSRKSEEGLRIGDKELVEGSDHRRIILDLFARCAEIECDTLLLGAMGTNGQRFPYGVIVTEIINAYAFTLKSDSFPRHLMLSLREADMRRHGLDQSELIPYVRYLTRLYH